MNPIVYLMLHLEDQPFNKSETQEFLFIPKVSTNNRQRFGSRWSKPNRFETEPFTIVET